MMRLGSYGPRENGSLGRRGKIYCSYFIQIVAIVIFIIIVIIFITITKNTTLFISTIKKYPFTLDPFCISKAGEQYPPVSNY